MICTKTYTVECEGQCLNLTGAWTATPSNNNPPNYIASGSGSDQNGNLVLRQIGGGFIGVMQVQFTKVWVGIPGRTLRVRCRFQGVINTTGLPNNYQVRCDSNGVTQDTGLVPTAVGVNNIDVTVTADSATEAADNFLVFCNVGTRGTSNLSAEVSITCIPP